MSKKRGLSLEDKRDKMLEIFFETQDFFLLKELEKSGPRKGVISQSIKDVLESLVGDDLVFKEKIGTSVYFWSLPSRAGNQLMQKKNSLMKELEGFKRQRVALEEQKESMKAGREEGGEREAALAEMHMLEAKKAQLSAELDLYSDNDPAVIQAMRESAIIAKEAANRWTDNIFSLQQWCSRTFPDVKESVEGVFKEAGIMPDLDYVD